MPPRELAQLDQAEQGELKEMLDKLEADRNMEVSERLKLEEEIASKQVSNGSKGPTSDEAKFFSL